MASRWQKFKQFLTGVEAPASESTASGTTNENPQPYSTVYDQLTHRATLRSTIRDIRHYDASDGRIKRIHNRLKRDVTRGGLRIRFATDENLRIKKAFEGYVKRLKLSDRARLESRARLLVVEGNLPVQWVVDNGPDGRPHVMDSLVMPILSLSADVDDLGRFLNSDSAWKQTDAVGNVLTTFGELQLTNARLDPLNYDNPASFGRPFLDAGRTPFKRLQMTEDDAVVRRRSRAPSRNLHVLDGATEQDLQNYEREVEIRRRSPDRDFYSNKKAAVTNISGDSNLDQVEDIKMLQDAFFAIAGPKGLYGYTDGLSRDVLEDLKRDYYEDVDSIQDALAWLFEQGFRLELLLQGIAPDSYDFDITFKERITETPVQRTDRALKLQAIGASQKTVFETAGVEPEQEAARIKVERQDPSRYGHDQEHDLDNPKQPRVSVTPSNARKGDSATTISNH